jgi:CHASE3 domain sensor protein
MSIRSKIFAGLGLVVLFFLVQAVAVWFFNFHTRDQVVAAVAKNTTANAKLEELAVLAQQIRRFEKEYFIYVNDPAQRAKYEKEWSDTHAAVTKALETMLANRDHSLTADDLKEVPAWQEAAGFYGDEMRSIFAQVDKPVARGDQSPAALDAAEVNGRIREGKDRFAALIKGVNALSKNKSAETLNLASLAAEAFQRLFYLIAGSVVLGCLIACGLVLTLPGAVTRPIESLTAAADELSKGELDKQFSAEGVVEFARLAEALERLRAAQQAFTARLRAQKPAAVPRKAVG